MRKGKKFSKENEVEVGATVKIKGKTLIAKSAKNGAGVVARAVEEGVKAVPAKSPKPAKAQKNQTIREFVGADKFPESEQWDDVGNNTHEGFFTTLCDAGLAKITGYVKYGGEWYDIRTWKEMKDDIDTFYLSPLGMLKDHGKRLKVIV